MNKKKSTIPTSSPVFWSLLVVNFFVLSSCTEGRISQCQKIIFITKNMAEISQKSRQTQDLDAVLKVADAFETSAESLKKLNLADPKLVEYQAQLAKIYQGNAKSTRQFVLAFKNRDIPGVTLAKQEVQILGEQEQQLVGKINQYCYLRQIQ